MLGLGLCQCSVKSINQKPVDIFSLTFAHIYNLFSTSLSQKKIIIILKVTPEFKKIIVKVPTELNLN